MCFDPHAAKLHFIYTCGAATFSKLPHFQGGTSWHKSLFSFARLCLISSFQKCDFWLSGLKYSVEGMSSST